MTSETSRRHHDQFSGFACFSKRQWGTHVFLRIVADLHVRADEVQKLACDSMLRCIDLFSSRWSGLCIRLVSCRETALQDIFGEAETAVCTRCEELLPITMFRLRAGKPTGRELGCRTCDKEYQAARRKSLVPQVHQTSSRHTRISQDLRKPSTACVYGLRLGQNSTACVHDKQHLWLFVSIAGM